MAIKRINLFCCLILFLPYFSCSERNNEAPEYMQPMQYSPVQIYNQVPNYVPPIQAYRYYTNPYEYPPRNYYPYYDYDQYYVPPAMYRGYEQDNYYRPDKLSQSQSDSKY